MLLKRNCFWFEYTLVFLILNLIEIISEFDIIGYRTIIYITNNIPI